MMVLTMVLFPRFWVKPLIPDVAVTSWIPKSGRFWKSPMIWAAIKGRDERLVSTRPNNTKTQRPSVGCSPGAKIFETSVKDQRKASCAISFINQEKSTGMLWISLDFMDFCGFLWISVDF